MSEEKKVIHEVKLDKSIIKLLWVFAVVLLLNAVPKDALIPEAFAQSRSDISFCWNGATIDKRNESQWVIRTYC